MLVAAAALVLFVFWAPAASAAPKRTIILVVDTSDSMNSDNRLEQAQSALRSTIGSLAGSDVVGLHEFSGDCSDGGELTVQPGTGNRAELRGQVDRLQTSGGTPTPAAIRKAAEGFPKDSSQKVLILVSDGASTCGDPCPEVTKVQEELGIKFVAHTVGFDTQGVANTQLSCIADVTGGKYFAATDEEGITSSLAEALKPIVGEDVSTILNSLPTPSDVPLDAESVGKTALLAGALVLLIGFPAELFNRTLEANQKRISRWWRRRGTGGMPGATGGAAPAAAGGPFPPGGAGMQGGPSGAGSGPYAQHGGDAGGPMAQHSGSGSYAQHSGGGFGPGGSAGMQGDPSGGGAFGPGGSAGMQGDPSGAGSGPYAQHSGSGYGPGGSAGMQGDPSGAGSGAYGSAGMQGDPSAAGGFDASGNYRQQAGGSGPYPAAAVPGAGAVRSLWASPWILPIFVLLSALASTFVDPDSGFDAKSGILLLGFLIAAPVILFAYAWPNEQVAKRASNIPAKLKTVPAALALAVFCTMLSRFSDFVPGYVFGLVLGYVALRERRLSRAAEGKGVLFGALTALVVAAGAWVGLEFVHEDATAVDANVGLVIADTILGTTFILGVETVIFGLVPLRFMDGNKLRKWNTWIWLATYALAVLLFVHVLVLNSGQGGSDSETSLTAALILFAGFGLAAALFWAWFKYIPDPALHPHLAMIGMPQPRTAPRTPRAPRAVQNQQGGWGGTYAPTAPPAPPATGTYAPAAPPQPSATGMYAPPPQPPTGAYAPPAPPTPPPPAAPTGYYGTPGPGAMPPTPVHQPQAPESRPYAPPTPPTPPPPSAPPPQAAPADRPQDQ
ncbi:FGLLP motif-containing membrane protein [Yinghuangia soli]|uniref:VWA domain-containing protein n=1 Tax=Yinghuangia soli TaxID=2908204 RepID=A0AA41U077_9ACTN|nr:FGLLP motif-containing membrane protein [Yinghuangia soli]MCF2528301.1 VWA domain-containing protein [Yinghuangia soli]